MKQLAIGGLFLALAATQALAQVNAGDQKPEASVPFNMVQVTTLNLPWRIAFLPDGRMLITEKVGPVWLVTQKGDKTPVANVPAVLSRGQGGMLGIYLSPHYAKDHSVYLTYSEPGEPGGSSLALAKAELKLGPDTASLEDLKVIWRDGERGNGGQFGAQIAFSPDSKYLFLTVGDRQRMTPAQDPDQPLGKILRLTLDGKPAPGNPMAGKIGASIPAWLAKAYEGLDDDVETRRITAAAVLADQVQQLRTRGFDQFHFYTLNQANLTYAACRILGIRPKEIS